MKYMFSIEKGDSGYNRIILPQELKLVEYVFMDMECFARPVFQETIERVVNGVSDNENTGGNMCSLEISRDFTIVFSEFILDGMSHECKIETDELLALIQVWIIINKSLLY
ncbi:hypothetical protein [Clostridium sp.]|uniref:hypothetical protein n=1 Tax=Clostridium sp. TaxID=1506 RepID=UPI003463B943